MSIGFTKRVPDFFLIFVFTSLFLISTVLDTYLLYQLFIVLKDPLFAVIFYSTTWISTLFIIIVDQGHEWVTEGRWQIIIFILVIFHLEALIIACTVIKDACQKPKGKMVHPGCRVFFHIKEKHLSYMKTYCFHHSALKCLPQLFLLSIFLLLHSFKGTETTVLICEGILFNNAAIFSLSMATLFPVRKTARVFSSDITLILSALFKFMAAMSSCALFWVLFVETFKTLGYYALILRSVRFLLLIWPCWKFLRPQCASQNWPLVATFLYCFLFSIAFSFLYIHPFAGRGLLLYYFLYLFYFILDIFCLYLFTPGYNETGILLFALGALTGGFASLFGLVNILHKSRNEIFLCVQRSMSPQ